ncbi:hypothetical protein CspeluHIS016_0302880 [Cutaneotrichosporon spelunceum]|uniref:Structure-specific endonuclease subunit SLX4 n=1 Tax=Cutaneotrichosporon spelunceum TaxID=1672016 RepID=A0AAD3TTR1_9TREE|nr:hypothetical protein CspeluHIS016_0302880 [Cutaneotrichosporon spelunceum]
MRHHVLVDDSDSDEPIALGPPPSVAARRVGSSSSLPLAGPAGPSRSAKRGRRKKHMTPDDDNEDDEVEFVREETVCQLTNRFAFNGTRSLYKKRSTTSTTSAPTSSVGSTSSSSTLIATPFLSCTPREPLPVPEWLPRTAILKELTKCVLCQRDFKKAESGAARWRHLSTCSPPAFRPPNPPPDLETLISAALEGPVEELTLLRRRTNAAAAADGLMTSFPDLVPKPKRVLRNTTREVIDLCSPSPSPPRDDSPVDWDYGDGAVLEFDPGPDWANNLVVDSDSAVPTVSSRDTSHELSDIEWGRDAVLVWGNGEYDDGEVRFVEQDQEDEEGDEGEEDKDDAGDEELGEDEYEVHDIDVSDDEAPTGNSNNLPDYSSWDIPKLQHLVQGYGYRPSKDRKVLVKLATDLHPPQSTAANDEEDDGLADPSLDTLFYNLLTSDDSLYARILRYEPLPFDELVSRVLAAGVSTRGWRPRLKRFLDLKGVTYFTADPTAPRRRY